MVDNKEKKDCCGCRACEQICPKKAIKMIEDEKGFRYPVIDYNLCNKCGLCDDICAFNDDYENFGGNPEVYAVKHKDESIRAASTSGGMFTAISDNILGQGGVVYGAGYQDRLYVCHKRAVTKEQRDEFRGSKYVQSDIGDNFIRVKQDLKDNLKVLFTGTPCQVSALKSFLRHNYDNLLTVDFVCHGTPSNKLWQDFIDFIEKDTKNKVANVEFRNKDKSWHGYKTKLYLKKTNTKKIKGEQSFFRLFVANYMLMPSCHNCHYANFNRASDITIGDFWGIERTMPEFDDDKGVSLVLVNSDKGKALFDSITGSLDVRQSSKENCLQRHLQHSPPKNTNSDKFWSDYSKNGIGFVVNKYTDYGVLKTFIKKVILKLKSIITSYIKKS